jgi:hypothetical protein
MKNIFILILSMMIFESLNGQTKKDNHDIYIPFPFQKVVNDTLEIKMTLDVLAQSIVQNDEAKFKSLFWDRNAKVDNKPLMKLSDIYEKNPTQTLREVKSEVPLKKNGTEFRKSKFDINKIQIKTIDTTANVDFDVYVGDSEVKHIDLNCVRGTGGFWYIKNINGVEDWVLSNRRNTQTNHVKRISASDAQRFGTKKTSIEAGENGENIGEEILYQINLDQNSNKEYNGDMSQSTFGRDLIRRSTGSDGLAVRVSSSETHYITMIADPQKNRILYWVAKHFVGGASERVIKSYGDFPNEFSFSSPFRIAALNEDYIFVLCTDGKIVHLRYDRAQMKFNAGFYTDRFLLPTFFTNGVPTLPETPIDIAVTKQQNNTNGQLWVVDIRGNIWAYEVFTFGGMIQKRITQISINGQTLPLNASRLCIGDNTVGFARNFNEFCAFKIDDVNGDVEAGQIAQQGIQNFVFENISAIGVDVSREFYASSDGKIFKFDKDGRDVFAFIENSWDNGFRFASLSNLSNAKSTFSGVPINDFATVENWDRDKGFMRFVPHCAVSTLTPFSSAQFSYSLTDFTLTNRSYWEIKLKDEYGNISAPIAPLVVSEAGYRREAVNVDVMVHRMGTRRVTPVIHVEPFVNASTVPGGGGVNRLGSSYQMSQPEYVQLSLNPSISKSDFPIGGGLGEARFDCRGLQITYHWSYTTSGCRRVAGGGPYDDYITFDSRLNPEIEEKSNQPTSKKTEDIEGPEKVAEVYCYTTVVTDVGTITSESKYIRVGVQRVTPPGGCPYIYTKGENGYQPDNNILHRSEFSENRGRDITDRYKLRVSPTLQSNEYKFFITELDSDHSYLDRLRLLAVDHPQNTALGVTENNQIAMFPMAGVTSSPDAWLNRNNVTRNIQYDSLPKGASGVPQDMLRMRFEPAFAKIAKAIRVQNEDDESKGEQIEGSDAAVITTLETDGPIIINPPSKRPAGTITLSGSGGNRGGESQAQSFARREMQSVVMIPVPVGSSMDSVRVNWNRQFKMGYMAVTPITYNGFAQRNLNLSTARHTRLGDVRTRVLSQNRQYAELLKGDTLYLSFQNQTAVPQGMKRSFVFETRGRYEVLGDSSAMQGESTSSPKPLGVMENTASAIPKDFGLSQNFPNPFNPATVIRYALPQTSSVTIKLYDELGRVVSTLVNDTKSAGYHNVTFNASHLASGIYFYRIQAGNFVETKKMLLVK